MPLQDELRELFAQVGPQVFDDADTFRGAFDDFVPEGAATPGELRLLVDAISTGAFRRLAAQLAINADPTTAIASEAAALARDRGTVETDGAQWALSALAYARGLADAGAVTTRPSALGTPSAPAPEPSRPTPAISPAAFEATYISPAAEASVPGPPVPPEPSTVVRPPLDPPAPPPARNRRWLAIVVAAVAALAVAVVAAIVLLGDGDKPEDEADDPVGDDSSASSGPDASASTSQDTGGSGFASAPSDLPDLPPGFPATFEFDVRLPQEFQTSVTAAFGEGVATEVYSGGDPESIEVQSDTGPEPTALKVQDLVDSGIPARVKYYTLRQVRQNGGDANGPDILDLLQDTDAMAIYWTNVRDLLTRLGTVDAPIELIAEPDLASEILSNSPDATTVPTAVAAAGVEGLDGLPDTFAGWAQAWLALRDELAPQVRIGLSVAPWQINNDFLPKLPTANEAEHWAASFGDSYATLGARFDFLDNIMVYSEGGAQGDDYIAGGEFFDRLLTWVEGISSATDTRVILDNVPVGNSVYRTLDNTDFHFRDGWAEWILGDDDFDNLVALRDAGVIGIVFGVDAGATTTTCPCDWAGDGVSNPGDTGKRSTSADDDGGYLAERLQAYAATGGLPL